MKKVLWGFALVIVASIIVIACRKQDSTAKENTNLVFDLTAAKEWWYGDFRKSADYQSIDLKSPIAPSSGTSTKKYPNWAKAFCYLKSGMEVVELPLHYETNSVLLLGMQNLGKTPEATRVAGAAIHRLLIFKTANKRMVVRTVTLIPSAEFAKKNNYDLSFIKLDKLPLDFEGHLIIACWDQKIKNIIKFSGGKPVRKVRIVSAEEFAKRQSSGLILNRQVCTSGGWVEDREWVCVIVRTGDQAADDQRCQDQGYWVTIGQHYEMPECEEVPDEDPVDECLNSGDPTMCYCLMYGTCGDEGNGEYIDEQGYKRPFSSSNFRYNLGVKTGQTPPANMQAHHVFPQASFLASKFAAQLIDIHDPKYGVWWPTTSHQNNAAAYNAAWTQWFNRPDNPNPSATQILAQGRIIMASFGFTQLNY